MTESAVEDSGRRGVAGESLLGLHHIGIPVRDLERSLQWYGELFGLGPDFVQVAEGPDVSQIVQLDDVRLRFAFIRLPNVMLELLEYERPAGADFDRRNCDIGAVHVCFEVADIERVHRLLTDWGIAFSTAPIRQSGAIEGHTICYFRDPDGIQLELWQRPSSTN
jgi:catechol 2,3-dioxygenase-like lactoylglutathione lyase family enzyme